MQTARAKSRPKLAGVAVRHVSQRDAWRHLGREGSVNHLDACLNHFIFLGERHLRYVINEYVSHYHERRYHQGLDGQLIQPFKSANDDEKDGTVKCQSRLGGMLNYYYREAA